MDGAGSGPVAGAAPRPRPPGAGSGLPLPSLGTTEPGDSDVLLHRDLHPQNVILTQNGPVLIDWEGAARGPAIADVAMTWVIIGFSSIPGQGLEAALVRGVQGIFTRSFVRAAGPIDG